MSIYEPMHANENEFLLSSYDVLVVGAGIGGLTAGALLAKRGLKVLVIEQHYLPGGCASIFRRKGFTFDVGASLFFGFGEQGYNPHQFVMNYIEEDITLIPMDETFTIHIDKKTQVSMYTDRERFRNELCNCFPSEDARRFRLSVVPLVKIISLCPSSTKRVASVTVSSTVLERSVVRIFGIILNVQWASHPS